MAFTSFMNFSRFHIQATISFKETNLPTTFTTPVPVSYTHLLPKPADSNSRKLSAAWRQLLQTVHFASAEEDEQVIL